MKSHYKKSTDTLTFFNFREGGDSKESQVGNISTSISGNGRIKKLVIKDATLSTASYNDGLEQLARISDFDQMTSNFMRELAEGFPGCTFNYSTGIYKTRMGLNVIIENVPFPVLENSARQEYTDLALEVASTIDYIYTKYDSERKYDFLLGYSNSLTKRRPTLPKTKPLPELVDTGANLWN